MAKVLQPLSRYIYALVPTYRNVAAGQKPETGPAGLKVKGKVRFWAAYRLRAWRDMIAGAVMLMRQDRTTPLVTAAFMDLCFCWLRTFAPKAQHLFISWNPYELFYSDYFWITLWMDYLMRRNPLWLNESLMNGLPCEIPMILSLMEQSLWTEIPMIKNLVINPLWMET